MANSGTLFLFVLLSVFILGGLTMIAFGVRNYVKASQTTTWEPTEGRITFGTIDVTMSFGSGGAVETVKCRRCGCIATRAG